VISRTEELFEAALDQAVIKHFGTLFEVMMVESDADAAMKRFGKGLARLTERERIVREVIRKP
jgi:hypothetical protein